MKLTIEKSIHLAEIPKDLRQDLISNFTLPNPKYIDAVKFKRQTCGIDRELKFYVTTLGGGLSLPRGAGSEIYKIASKVGKTEVLDNRHSLPDIDVQFNGVLRPYQQQAVDGILVKEQGVVEAGTGSGKTVMATATIAARKQPTLILVHTKELLYQWQNRIKTFLGIDAGLVGAGKFDIQPITIAIVNTARKHLNKLPQHFGHLVVDECHRVPSTLFTEVVTAFNAKYMLGLSATPYRRDGLSKLIGWYLGLHRVRVNMAVLHETGAVLHPEIVIRETNFRYSYADDYQKMISALVEDNNRNALIAGDIKQQSQKNGLSLVVSDRIDHLKELAARADTDHHLLTGKTSHKKRREIVKSLAGGNVRVLFSTLSLIGEGFDCPDMDALFLTTPIKFSGRLKQVVGRVLRPSEGKEPVVFDYLDSNVGLLNHQAKSRQKVFETM